MANLLGARRYYRYTSDTGQNYSILTDQDLGDAAGLTLNDTDPPLPRRFRPRVVFCEAVVSGRKVRKALPILRTSTLYSDASATVTIAGTAFKTTGRKGEKVSFGANPSA